MAVLRSYRAADLHCLADVWNACFAGGPNFVRVTESDLRSRVFAQPQFNPDGVLVAEAASRLIGFVHFGPRLHLWPDPGQSEADDEEGQIYQLVAPESDRPAIGELLAAAELRLRERGARRLLLGTSWVYGGQPYYNGIAGAYEIPGLSIARANLVSVAQDMGFVVAAEYGTPELRLDSEAALSRLANLAAALRERASRWDIEPRARRTESRFFPSRALMELLRGRETVATTAYGLWPEYARHYGRQMFGLTSVYVAPGWRGQGLGKLAVIEALQRAAKEGAEAAHLHVWRENKPAWQLYHRALGFQPTHAWATLEKKL